MSKPNPFLEIGKIAAVWKTVDNGTKQYKAMEALGRSNEDHTRELAEQSALISRQNEIQAYKVQLDRERNSIQSAQLDAMERNNQININRNTIAKQEHELNLIRDRRRELRISIEENKNAIESRQRDCIFNINKDIEKINNSWDVKVEKYIQLANHLTSIDKFGISTELSSSFDDKEVINSTIEKLKSSLKKVIDQLSKEEVEDLTAIIKIFQVNEERLIAEAKFNLKNINKEISSCNRERKKLHKKEESFEENLAKLLTQLSKHNVNKPQ